MGCARRLPRHPRPARAALAPCGRGTSHPAVTSRAKQSDSVAGEGLVVGGFAPVQLDPGLDLLRELGRITKRHRNPVGSKREILREPLGNLLPAADLPRRPADLPYIRPPGEACPAPRGPRAEDDSRMALSAVSLLGITTQRVRETLTARLSPRANTRRRLAVHTHGDIGRLSHPWTT